MRALILSFVLLLPLPAAAQQDEIAGVIQQQLDAFNAGDIETAWNFASPNIRRMFGTPDNFGMMVQRGYPMVWTNRDAQFLELREDGGRIVQRVLVRDAAGDAYMLDYYMIETAQGWQINGVALLPVPDLGV